MSEKPADERDGGYGKQWDFVFKPQGGLRRVCIVEGGKQKVRYLTDEQLEIWNKARAPENRLEALERVMREKQDAEEGKAYSRMPVPVGASETACGLRWMSNVRAVSAVKTAFTASGYEVVSLENSAFDFVAMPGKGMKPGEQNKTYYVMVKCGKSVTARELSARQLRRAEEQYLMPRFGLDVVKLYWYVRTADNTHKTYEIGKLGWRGRMGMKPIANPLVGVMSTAPDALP